MNRRGATLGMAIVSAVIFSLAAYTALAVSLHRAQMADAKARRLGAAHAAEAGLVWAMGQLWANPTWDSPSGWSGPPNDPPDDLDGDGTPDAKVDVILPPCAQTPCEDRLLRAKVSY